MTVYFCAKVLLFFYLPSILSFFYLEISKKSSTFANVIELGRHIEILLLSNDCVIVPDLGGFMAHHIEANYDDEEQVFLPPQRTLGFNPQLKLNDSLLAQSYIEAYDISYPEALRRIEEEVTELKQSISTEGYYELNGLGTLKVNEVDKLEFEPCEAGILTPELYGLSSFEMPTLANRKRISEATIPTMHVINETAKVVEPVDDTEETVNSTVVEEAAEEEEHNITIKMSWVRNTVAIAAALLAFFLMTPNIKDNSQNGVSMSQMNLPIISKDASLKNVDKIDGKKVEEVLTKHEETKAKLNDDTQETPIEEKAIAVEPTEEPKAEAKAQPEVEEVKVQTIQPTYCIVLASQVSQHNAEAFVEKLQAKGMSDARVYFYNNIRRVICGQFSTETEAQRALQKVHRNEELADAWVYKIRK
jgi:cell division septation protein DedD